MMPLLTPSCLLCEMIYTHTIPPVTARVLTPVVRLLSMLAERQFLVRHNDRLIVIFVIGLKTTLFLCL